MQKHLLFVLALFLIHSSASCKCISPQLRVYSNQSNGSCIASAGSGVPPYIDSAAYLLPPGDSIRISVGIPSGCDVVGLTIYRNDSLISSHGSNSGIIAYVREPGKYTFCAFTEHPFPSVCVVDLMPDFPIGFPQGWATATAAFNLRGIGRDLQLCSSERLPFRLDLYDLLGAVVSSASGQSGPEGTTVPTPKNVQGVVLAIATWPGATIPKRVFVERLQ